MTAMTYHNITIVRYAHAIHILSFKKPAGRFAPLGGPGLVTSKKNMSQKMHLRPVRAQEVDGWPINGFDSHSKPSYDK